jgi:glutathione peroxidase
MNNSIYSIEVKKIDGQSLLLSEFKGKAMLVVNVASRCGFTPQYEGLEKLFLKYRDQGLVVLGFPCNQFRAQEPEGESEIASFCSLNFGVTFPLFSKIDVNGASAHPLFAFLKSKAKGILGTEAVKWNFTKFLVDRDGNVLKRFAPTTKPEDLEKDIRDCLGISSL